jgi:hypothetical protein
VWGVLQADIQVLMILFAVSAIFKYDKDRVKVRYLLNFTAQTAGGITGTVSLFLKWSKNGVKVCSSSL